MIIVKRFFRKVIKKIYYKDKYKYIVPVFTSREERDLNNFVFQPLISIIMPVYNIDPKWLDLAIKSVLNQWYKNWELCIVDDNSSNKDTVQYLKKLKHEKIKIKFLNSNRNISVASNEALKMANGKYVALMDHDDELTIDALYEVVKVLNQKNVDFIYSDEDKVDTKGKCSNPYFKPDFSPDMFLSQNYISHFTVIKKDIVDEVGGFEEGLEGAQDYDLYLKVLERTDKVYHINKVLYHWRKLPSSTAIKFRNKSYAYIAGKKALENAMKRRKISTFVKEGKCIGTYKMEYEIKGDPLVSIIIPFKDKAKFLKRCIESILEKSTYQNFEIIGVSNRSKEKYTIEVMKELEKRDERIKFHEYNIPFNYSKINNYAVHKFAKGKHIILLNNDIEIITPQWMEELLMHSQRENIGCVGAKLYYPNNSIQHAGIYINKDKIPDHIHKYFYKNEAGYPYCRLNIIQNVTAVTGACLMVKRSLYKKIGGLEEKYLKIAFNDVDFCLRLLEKGYLNIFTPYCEAYHYESISRGNDLEDEKRDRFMKELEYLRERHSEFFEKGDSYYRYIG